MRLAPAAGALALLVAATGCGGKDTGASHSHRERPDLTVAAASSLQMPLAAYGQQFASARVRYSFAGSDQLAAQIERGVRPDVFASANTKLPDLLFGKGLVSKPVAFAANRLVVAVPARWAAVKAVRDLERADVTIAIGSAAVPIGAYTRQVLGRLPARRRARILANVRSEEPDVNGVVGKLMQGAVDAGFTYATDVSATHGALKQIPLPESLQPIVAYSAAVTRGAAHPALARAFIRGLLTGTGRRYLLSAGFLPPLAR